MDVILYGRVLYIYLTFAKNQRQFLLKEQFEDTKGVIRIPIEEEQAAPEPKEKVQKDKQRSAKHIHKTKDRVTIAVS
jgi:hypothetical protein